MRIEFGSYPPTEVKVIYEYICLHCEAKEEIVCLGAEIWISMGPTGWVRLMMGSEADGWLCPKHIAEVTIHERP